MRNRMASARGSSSRVRLAAASGQTLEARLVQPGDRFGPGGRSVHGGSGSAIELLVPGGRGDHFVGLVDLVTLRDLRPLRKPLQLGASTTLALPAREICRLLAWANDPTALDEGLRALVAADDDRGRRIATALAPLDLTVETVDHGRLALASARMRPPDLVVATARLAVVDGYDVVRRIRASRGPQTRIVLIQDEGEGPELGRAAGADACISWPAEAERVAPVVARLLELV
jgi:CheY-like chemotaxis protein